MVEHLKYMSTQTNPTVRPPESPCIDQTTFGSLEEAVAVGGVPLVPVASQHQAVLDGLRARRRRVEEDGLAPLKFNFIDITFC